MKLFIILSFLFFCLVEGTNETGVSTTNADYTVVVYECDAELNRLGQDDKQEKKVGSVYQVCMAPDDAAKDAGIRIENLESWEWRTESNGEKIDFQPVADGKEAAPGLSMFRCLDEGQLCVFNSFLTSNFYQDAGTVSGMGEVMLTGGAGSVPVEVDLFLVKFNIKFDPEVQKYIEVMRDAAKAEL